MSQLRRKKFQRTLRYIIFLSTIAFILNYLWEIIQCSLFFIHASINPTQLDMVKATLGDVVMTWIAYGAVALVTKRWLWLFFPWRWPQWVTLLSTAFAMSIGMELYAISTGRWMYTENNPMIPGTAISAIPLVQLPLLFPLTFGIVRKLLREKGKTEQLKNT